MKLLTLLIALCSAISIAATPVTVSESSQSFALSNGVVSARIEKRTGILTSLVYQNLELLAQGHGGAEGGYWSSVGRSRPGSANSASIRINPGTNGGARAEIECRIYNNTEPPSASVDVAYRYSLGQGEHWLYASALLEHKPGYPPFSVGEARYCMKLNPVVFDYMTVDADRRRVMPSGYDWDHGEPLNLKEARRMTTGVHKGQAEHKYDYSAVLYDTPAYGWSSTRHHVGLWLINPSMEYLGGGPTKAELTGHLDVNPGGLPTLLNMWVGSHYGGTSLSVATNESWTKFVGPFLIYCNGNPTQLAASGTNSSANEKMHEGLWKNALNAAASEAQRWPYSWVYDPAFPAASQRGAITGCMRLRDSCAPDVKVTNLWVGLTAPDYTPPPRTGFGFGFGRRNFTNRWSRFGGTNSALGTNPVAPAFPNASNFAAFARLDGFPSQVDWQRDAKFYQFWSRANPDGTFSIPNVRPGSYSLHAFADGVLGEYTKTNITIGASEKKSLGDLDWTPVRYGRPLWEIGWPDRTAREFRHGDHYWRWGLYFDYTKEFPNDVNFVIGRSDPRKDWNYVQPPRITGREVAVVSEDDEQSGERRNETNSSRGSVAPSTWTITFNLSEAPVGKATFRLAFCGTHQGCQVEVVANGKPVGDTGPLPSTSAMQRDGIRAYWVEKAIPFDASLLTSGTNTNIKLLSRANSWSQGVMYDYLRLELD